MLPALPHLRVVGLRLAHAAEHERGLVGSSSSSGDAVARLPAPVDALGWVAEVQLHHLGRGFGLFVWGIE